MTYKIKKEKCMACGQCEIVCPHGAPHINDDGDAFEIDPEKCQDCGVCAEQCPAEAIVKEDD